MYWQEYFLDFSDLSFLKQWLSAFLFLSALSLGLSATALIFLPLLRNKPLQNDRALYRELFGRYLAFGLFCLFVPPRAGDFYANGGTDDIFFIHVPVMIVLSLVPLSFKVLQSVMIFETPWIFRGLRRAGLASLYAGWYGGSEGYAGEEIRTWSWRVAALLLCASFLPRIWLGIREVGKRKTEIT